jgi:hypothetical protein
LRFVRYRGDRYRKPAVICAGIEFVMANEAFALSPISARASLPSEEDYEAIREAFMETSRGRWFLTEYARRNRNADTEMVLDAVARIEETLAAQRQPPPAPDRSADVLAAVRSAVAQAEDGASMALDGMMLEENLAPIRKGARIIKEISWRWREIGADPRICDLIDSQVSAIEAGCGAVAGHDPRAALSAAFDLIKTSIEAFSSGEITSVEAEDVAEAAPPPPADNLSAGAVEQAETHDAAHAVATIAVENEPTETVIEAAPAELALEADAYDETDEAVLDMIAAEMAEPDPVAVDGDPDARDPCAHVAEPPLIEPFVVASDPKQTAMAEPSVQPSQPVAPAPSPEEPSLGATILATGILPRPKPAASDPLAPIRRMSQAEKIAFFS